MITVNGSTLEGGGQLVRVALALSAICRIPVHIDRIRANRAPRTPRSHGGGVSVERGSGRGRDRDRDKQGTGQSTKKGYAKHDNDIAAGSGGLKESHLAALKWLAEQTEAEVTGGHVGSCEVTSKPRRISSAKQTVTRRDEALESQESLGSAEVTETKDYTIRLKNPGSVWLIWQAIYPYIVFGTSSSAISPGSIAARDVSTQSSTIRYRLTLHGGTNVSKSMSYDYLTQVFIPICTKIGLPPVEVDLIRRGWAGNASEIAEVVISVDVARQPFVLPAFNICDRGNITRVDITIIASGEKLRSVIRDEVTVALKEAFRRQPAIWLSETRRESEELAISTSEEDSGHPRRLYILLVAHTSNGWRLGADYLGSGRLAKNEREQGQLISVAVKTAVSHLVREVEGGGSVDESMQDQLVIFQALSSGRGRVDGRSGRLSGDIAEDDSKNSKTNEIVGGEGSLHTRTVRWVCEQMLHDKGVEFGRAGECLGIGWNSIKQDATPEHILVDGGSEGDHVANRIANLSVTDENG